MSSPVHVSGRFGRFFYFNFILDSERSECMAYHTVLSACLQGLRVEQVYVEADVSGGLPMFHMVGYLSSEVREASERVRTAIRNTGIQIPPKKIMVNLAPATVRKRGASFDLPIAIAVLAALGAVPTEPLNQVLIVGELSLAGEVRKVPGILPIAVMAKKTGCRACILPEANMTEGGLVEGLEIIGVRSLKEVCDYLRRGEFVSGRRKAARKSSEDCPVAAQPDFGDIKGRKEAKRAAEVACAGGHNLLMIGPPGSGKTMLARRIPSILPPPTEQESMEITTVYSVLGLVDENQPLMKGRPFREVHHTVTKAALMGGGIVPVPGEISMAHHGVLFLDELTEFRKEVLEVLRQPLEEHKVRISRNHGTYTFPADLMLVAAMNPCPCGNYPDLNRCSCTQAQIDHYLSRVSQPFLDRIDICMEVPRMEYTELRSGKTEESSAEIRKRVLKAREIQRRRYEQSGILANAAVEARELERYCPLGEPEEMLMRQAFTSLSLTARTVHKILRVARTIADLEESGAIQTHHLKEAIGYRTIDKKYWGR